MTISDLTIIVRATQNKEEGSFERLYAYTYPCLLYNLIKKDISYMDAQDIAQDTMVKVYEKIHQLKYPCCYMKWVFRIAKSCLCNFMRKKEKTIMYDDELVIAEERGYMLPEHCIEILEQNEQLNKALSPLRYPLKQILILRYLEELSEKEIANVTSLPIGTVKSRLYYARQQIRCPI